ncbi:MAG: hypothetical protein IIB26_03225, partial [Chloroflexi bacterium]|nr:hypothetical protein [Chloroflexota bacterium]
MVGFPDLNRAPQETSFAERPGGQRQLARASRLAAIVFLTVAIVLASNAGSVVQGTEPLPARAQSPVEPALTKLHDLYLTTGSPVDPTALNSSYSPAGISDSGFLESAQVVGGLVLIEAASIDAPAALVSLEALGFAKGVAFGNVISGYLPIVAIPALESISGLQAIRMARIESSAGSVTSQGDAGLRADIARATHGVDGAGITIGVISDSYNCLGGAASDVASGDLPPGVVVQQELPGCSGGTDEGRAMMQLIHDLAPGADLIFQTGFTGAAAMAQGILDLQTAGADIIVDDIGYLTQPFFQDGVIAQAVDTVVAAGVAYFSAAGNDADQSYESDFRAGGSYALGDFPSAAGAPTFFGGVAHDFDPGPGVTEFQRITLPVGAVRFSLQWDQPALSAGG